MKHRQLTAQLSAGFGAIALLPLSVEATLFAVTDRPVSIDLWAPSDTFVTWDIDGDGADEFRITQSGFGSYDRRSYGPPPNVYRRVQYRDAVLFLLHENGAALFGNDSLQVISDSFTL